jgi:hypothetical protein
VRGFETSLSMRRVARWGSAVAIVVVVVTGTQRGGEGGSLSGERRRWVSGSPTSLLGGGGCGWARSHFSPAQSAEPAARGASRTGAPRRRETREEGGEAPVQEAAQAARAARFCDVLLVYR